MKSDLSEIKGKGGVSDDSRDAELENFSTKNYPKVCSYFYPVNADGEEEEKGEFIHRCFYYDFKTWMRVRLEPKAVMFSIHIGSGQLVEAEITEEILSVLKKRWPISAEDIEKWMKASAEFKEKRESAE